MAPQLVPDRRAGLDRDREAAAVAGVGADLVVVPQSQLARSPDRGRAGADKGQRAAAGLADQALGGRIGVEEWSREVEGLGAVGAEVSEGRGSG